MKHLFLFRTRRAHSAETRRSAWRPTGRAGVFLRLALIVGAILGAGRLVISAVECANSGNTAWTRPQSGFTSGIAVDDTNVLWTSEAVPSLRKLYAEPIMNDHRRPGHGGDSKWLKQSRIRW